MVLTWVDGHGFQVGRAPPFYLGPTRVSPHGLIVGLRWDPNGPFYVGTMWALPRLAHMGL